MRLLFATANAHKADEVRALLAGAGVVVETLADHPELPEPPEDGDTFEANALQKARTIHQRTGRPVIADDSGLEVDALGGAPGVRSKRFSPEQTHEANNALLLRRLEGRADRAARFRCVLALVTEHGEHTVSGACEGRIADAPRGAQGFGYDPVFLPDDLPGRTMAEASMVEKNAISHRGRAFAALPALLREARLGALLQQPPSPALAWFADATDAWARHRDDLQGTVGAFPGAGTPYDPDAGRTLAWNVLQQLESRITTQRLGARAGDAKTALESVAKLFEYTRGQVERAGPAAAPVADLLWWMLNRDVRPFTAGWHGPSRKGLLDVEDIGRRFRADLDQLRLALRAWAALLRALATGSPLDLPPPVRRPRAGLEAPDRRRMATTPCPVDGLAVPTPLPDAWPTLVARERDALRAWRATLGRPEHAVLTGVALSGGGIRSATFSLGILRALARRIDVLGVDYVSTVSGGGYLGSLLAVAWQRGLVDPERPGRGPLGGEGTRDRGAALVGWLRGRSETMRYDLALVGSIVGNVFSTTGGAAAAYRSRLRETWVIDRDPDAGDDFPFSVTSGAELRLADLRAPAPVQVWNLALNATNLPPIMAHALRGRGADLFTVTPFGTECRLLGFAEPAAWEVSAAMALSGAASAPTTSETRSGWAVRIATALGTNLGAWVDTTTGANRQSTWWEHVRSVFGRVDAEGPTVFLSDGGHVENSGVYALLRRRCGFILAIDGEADPAMAFNGLTELQHLARVELGVVLDVDTTPLEPDERGETDAHFTVARITYPPIGAQPAQEGVLVYAKLSLTGDEPRYVRRYRQLHPEFPHTSTVAVQAYDDKTFEAYLALGEHVGEQLLSPGWAGDLEGVTAFEDWMERVATRWTEG